MINPLNLEAVHYASPIPANAAVLTMLGLVFDKVYFPGVYLPRDGFDQAELDKEIKRLVEDVPPNHDTAVLIAILSFVRHAQTLAGFCEFTATRDDVFEESREI